MSRAESATAGLIAAILREERCCDGRASRNRRALLGENNGRITGPSCPSKCVDSSVSGSGLCRYTCKDSVGISFEFNMLAMSADVSTPRIYRILPSGGSARIAVTSAWASPSADRARNPAAVAAVAVARPTHQAVSASGTRSRTAPSTACADVKTTAEKEPSGRDGDRNSGAISGAMTGLILSPKREANRTAKASAWARGRVSSTGMAGIGRPCDAGDGSDCLAMPMVLPAVDPSRNGRPWTGR